MLLEENITANYKKCDSNAIEIINKEAQKIISNLKIPGKIPKLQQQDAFITFKDHKPGFPNKPKCRVINPSKTNIGQVAKKILDQLI